MKQPKVREVVYEPHPVSAERKKELNDKGFRIIDARFKPKDDESPSAAQASVSGGEGGAGKAGKKPSHGLRIDDIKAKLTEKGIEFDDNAERADLAKQLDEAPE